MQPIEIGKNRMKTLLAIAMAAVTAIAMAAATGQAQAHHKPGYHDSWPKPLKPQLPKLPRPNGQ